MLGMPSHVKQDLKNAQLILESLKTDHEQALRSLKGLCSSDEDCRSADKPNSNPDAAIHSIKDGDKLGFNHEKIPLIKAALNQIQNGLDDSEVLFTFAKYVECLEAENTKLQLHNQRLCEEASWLRDELKYTQTKLCENESLLAKTLVEKQHLEFTLELKQIGAGTDRTDDELIDADKSSTASFERSLGLVDNNRMVHSVLGLTSSTNHRPTPTVKPESRGSLSKGAGGGGGLASSLGASQTLDMSTLMNSSMLDGELVGGISSTQSYHPTIMATNGISPINGSNMVPPRLKTLHRIVMQYTSQGKHEVAASLCVQAVADLERSTGREQTEVAVLLNMLALVYRDQGKYNEASELLRDVVSIREKALGSDHPLVAAALNNLAVLYAKASRFSDAEPLCRRALAIREKVLGPNHPDVAKQLNNLALLCQSQGQFDQVESCFRRALDIYLKNYKPSSAIVLKAKNNLASVLLKRDNLDVAESLLKSVLSANRDTDLASFKHHNLQHNQQLLTPPSSCIQSTDSAIQSYYSSVASSVTGASPSATSDGTVFCNGHSPTRQLQSTNLDLSRSKTRIVPVWLLAEQTIRDCNDDPSMLQKVDLARWATDAQIEISIVLNAVRTLAMVYQRQGLHAQSNLLRCWLQPHTSGIVNSSPGLPSRTPSKPEGNVKCGCASTARLFTEPRRQNTSSSIILTDVERI